MFGMLVFFTDKIQAAKSKGEVLVFHRGHVPRHIQKMSDEEAGLGERWNDQDTTHEKQGVASIHHQTKIFHWKDVVYDIKIKGKPRRLLDHVDGWVKPGTLTALMVIPPHLCCLFFLLTFVFGMRLVGTSLVLAPVIWVLLQLFNFR